MNTRFFVKWFSTLFISCIFFLSIHPSNKTKSLKNVVCSLTEARNISEILIATESTPAAFVFRENSPNVGYYNLKADEFLTKIPFSAVIGGKSLCFSAWVIVSTKAEIRAINVECEETKIKIIEDEITKEFGLPLKTMKLISGNDPDIEPEREPCIDDKGDIKIALYLKGLQIRYVAATNEMTNLMPQGGLADFKKCNNEK